MALILEGYSLGGVAKGEAVAIAIVKNAVGIHNAYIEPLILMRQNAETLASLPTTNRRSIFKLHIKSIYKSDLGVR